MILRKRKSDNSTIRKVLNEEKTKVLAVVGTIQDLMDANIIFITPGKEQYSRDTYMCIPNTTLGHETWGGFGATAEEAVEKSLLPEV